MLYLKITLAIEMINEKAYFSIGNCMHLSAINCTSNSQVIAQGKAKCNFDCYKYNYSLLALKYIWLPTNHIALPMILFPYT